MSTIKISCPKCGGSKHDIILEEREGHRIPIGFKCLEPGCGWQGPSRKITWEDGEEINGGSGTKTLEEMKKEAEARGDWHAARFKGVERPKRSRSQRIPSRKPSIQEPEPITLPSIQPLDHNLMSTTPVTCPTCGQPVIEIWGKIDGIIHWEAGILFFDSKLTDNIKCSVCGEPIGLDALVDKFSLVQGIHDLKVLPVECNNCHVVPDNFPIVGDLVFSWTGEEWKASGEIRQSCPGCSGVLSIYKLP